MAGFVFQCMKRAIAAGDFVWTTSPAGLILLDADGGFVEDPTIDTLDAIVGQIDVPGYEAAPFGARTVDRSDPDVVARWNADDVTFPAIGPGADVGGAVVLWIDSDAAVGRPGIYLPSVTGTLYGTDFVVSFPDGVLVFRDPE